MQNEFIENPEIPELPAENETGEPIPNMTTDNYAKPQKVIF